MLALLVLVVSVVSIVGPGVRPASADVTGELYQDAKAVIEDLLSAEITRALVPQIVCRAGRQEELATPSDCTQTLGEADPAAVCLRIGPRFQVVRLRLLQYFPATLQALYSRRFAALRSTVAHEVVDVASDTFYRVLREDLAHLQKQLTATHDPGVRLALEYANEIAPPADTVLTPLEPAALASCVTQVRARFGHGFTTAVSALDAACTPSSGDNALECELSLAMRAALRGQVPQSQARLRRALALWLAHGMLARLPLSTASTRALVKPLGDELTSLLVTQENAPADPQAFATFARRSAALLEQHCATTVDACAPVGAAASPAAAGPAAAGPAAAGPAASPAAAGPAAAGPTLHDSLQETLRATEPALTRVVARLRAVTASGQIPLTMHLMIADLAETLAGPGSLCERSERPACGLLRELDVRIGKGSLLWPAVTAASSGDLRGVAHLVLAALFQRDTTGEGCDQQSNDEGCKRDSFRRFADSLVMYVLDGNQGDSSEAVRTVFRQSAAEAIRFVSPFGGLDRGPAQWWVPELALRASWNVGYTSDSSSHLRYVASLTLARVRKVFWYTDRSYASLQLSLFDPLAPLAELALRADQDPITRAPVRYTDEGQLWWNVLTPRLEWTAALPWLSKHLALGAGVSLRIVTPTDRAVDARGVSYTYQGLGGGAWYEHLEASVALKYLP